MRLGDWLPLPEGVRVAPRLWLLVPLPLALAFVDTVATLPVVLGVTVEVTKREGLALAVW